MTMAYSLLSRFRGTFLGVAIAESQMGIIREGDRDSRLMLASAESLIRCGGLNLSDWKEHCIIDKTGQNPPASFWLTLLPIALFYHDHESRLEQQLKKVISLWPEINSIKYDRMMEVGWAIAHLLNKKFESNTKIYQILKGLKEFEDNPPSCGQYLLKINSLVAESASLETAMVELKTSNDPDSTAIALGFYCFLSTAENFQISIQRAAWTQPQPHLTTLLTGALSGAYNSCAGIPMIGQFAKSEMTTRQTRIIEPITVADRLFATWLGLYDVPHHMEKKPVKSLMMAVTAPNLLEKLG